jgi:hypothetical protein
LTGDYCSATLGVGTGERTYSSVSAKQTHAFLAVLQMDDADDFLAQQRAKLAQVRALPPSYDSR